MSPSSTTSDERADCVWPNHFEELSDIDAYDYMVFAKSKEPCPKWTHRMMTLVLQTIELYLTHKDPWLRVCIGHDAYDAAV